MRFTTFGLAALAVSLIGAPAHAATKVSLMCMYESGQNGKQKISDYTIWNSSPEVIPKGATISFQTSGAPGKTFGAKTTEIVAPQDTFATGGTYPSGDCTAWWTK